MISKNYSGFLFTMMKFYIDHLGDAYRLNISGSNMIMIAHVVICVSRIAAVLIAFFMARPCVQNAVAMYLSPILNPTLD